MNFGAINTKDRCKCGSILNFRVTSYELQTLFKVYIGDYDLHVLSDGPMTVKSISKLILHRQFHQQFFYNDIAVN